MKIRKLFTNKPVRRGILAGAVLSFSALSLFVFASASANTTVTGPRDCDNGSVIYCGALSTDELNTKFVQNSYGDLPGIFNHFGISAAEVSGLNSNVTIGEVHADGTVWAAGKLIGVNALTAGRTKTPNSVAIPGTNAYTRPPSDSFATPTTRISIFIGSTTDAKPWAVITSCGNPLTWDKPDIDIEKTVAKKGESSFSENVVVDQNGKATFKITVSETSNKVPVTNVVVKDTLPSGLTFVNGSVMVGGVSKPNLTPSNIPLGTMAKGQKIVITFDVVAKLIEKECGDEKMINKASVTADMQKPKEDDASVNVKKLCEVYACEDLSGPSILKRGQTASYTAKASTENTRVEKYIFSIDGKVVATQESNVYNYTANQEGTFTISVSVKFANGKTATSEDCKMQVKVSEDKCPIPGKENLPVDSPDCYEPCPIPGKENLRKDSPDCKDVQAAVTTLPNTGAGSIAGLFGSVSIAGAVLHRRFTLKRQ
jgi:uncharacterized repeat protein (TIGR01451 family)